MVNLACMLCMWLASLYDMEEGYTSDESHLMVYLDLLPAPSPFDSMVCSSSSFDVDFDLLPSVGSPSGKSPLLHGECMQ